MPAQKKKRTSGTKEKQESAGVGLEDFDEVFTDLTTLCAGELIF